jgi:hypothetical protein
MKGGKREGAGRPKAEPTTPVMLRLTEAQRLKFLELGGSRWAKRLLDEAIEQTRGKS